jgi:hypothetical protein
MATMHRQWASLGLATLVGMSAAAGTQARPKAPVTVLDAVAVTAWLHVDDGRLGEVTVEVVVDGTVNRGGVAANGRVDVMLPAGVVAVLRFTRPGHLTKEVVVDTRHVNDGGFNGKRRHVRCAVILQTLRDTEGQTYAGPVGAIRFEEGGGCLTVDHDKRLVREAPPIMVF